MAKTRKRKVLTDDAIVAAFRETVGPVAPRGAMRDVARRLGCSYSRINVALRHAGVSVEAESHAYLLAQLVSTLQRRERVTESQSRVAEAVIRCGGNRAKAVDELRVTRQFVYHTVAGLLQDSTNH